MVLSCSNLDPMPDHAPGIERHALLYIYIHLHQYIVYVYRHIFKLWKSKLNIWKTLLRASYICSVLFFFPLVFFKIYAWNIFLMAIGFFTFFSKPLRQIWCRPFSTYIGCTINHDGPSHILFDISLHPLAVSLRENSKSKLLIEVKQFLFLWSFLLYYLNKIAGTIF